MGATDPRDASSHANVDKASGPDPQRRNWRAWYAEYMVAEQTGNELPS
jgi:hypothetical protein